MRARRRTRACSRPASASPTAIASSSSSPPAAWARSTPPSTKRCGERIALKTLVADLFDDRRVERFRSEIQLARKVTHPNVCRIFDLGQHRFAPGDTRGSEPLLFLTMELIEGPTLAQRLGAGRLGLDEAERLVDHLCAALGAAHESGIIHRDFKASNVLLRVGGEGSRGIRAVVTDFGLALPEDAGHADHDVAIGTPEYMAPEQLRGEPLTSACDLYALGCVMFEMVTGQLPFPSDNPYARLDAPAPSARSIARDVPERWERAIARCLERDPKDRFASAAEVAAAIATGSLPLREAHAAPHLAGDRRRGARRRRRRRHRLRDAPARAGGRGHAGRDGDDGDAASAPRDGGAPSSCSASATCRAAPTPPGSRRRSAKCWSPRSRPAPTCASSRPTPSRA